MISAAAFIVDMVTEVDLIARHGDVRGGWSWAWLEYIWIGNWSNIKLTFFLFRNFM